MAGYLDGAVASVAIVIAGAGVAGASALGAGTAGPGGPGAGMTASRTATAALPLRPAAPGPQAAPRRQAGSGQQAARAGGGYGPYVILASPTLNERSAPSLDAASVGTLAYGSAVFISCQASGSLVAQSVVWDRLTSGRYVADYWVSTPGHDTWTPGIPRCAGSAPSARTGPSASTGRTVSYNEGGTGECTWWAIEEFRGYAGMYPDLYDPANNGDARYWATDAAANGWTVTSRPQPDSIAVFPPGANGAQSEGHVAWVTGVSGSQITISEMNGPAGWDVVDTRTLVPARSVRYILPPST